MSKSRKESGISLKTENISSALNEVSKKIAPLWPLDSFVAVNPYLGLADKSFEDVADDLSAKAGISTTMSVDYYLAEVQKSRISMSDLGTVLEKRDHRLRDVPEQFIKEVKEADFHRRNEPKINSLAEVVKKVSAANWPDFMVDHISSWSASFFDHSQNDTQKNSTSMGVFKEWKMEAEINRGPSYMGLKGFHKIIKELPENYLEAAEIALKELKISEDTLPIYAHSLLLRIGGWSSYIAHIDWDNQRYGKESHNLSEFLSILICWEYGVFKTKQDAVLESEWKAARNEMLKFKEEKSFDPQLEALLILQEAFDLSAQKKLVAKFDGKAGKNESSHKAEVQAVFCIDVRSEVYRRNLETVAPEIDTLGFAGFFGFPINFIKLGHDKGFDQCPALIPSAFNVIEKVYDEGRNTKLEDSRRLDQVFGSAWKTFKSSAITCFGFVSPVGLSLLPKLFTDSFGLTRPVPHPHKNSLNKEDIENLTIDLTHREFKGMSIGIPLADRIAMAKGALTAMSLKENFARVVMIVGHGSTSVNNPHASGLDCGACAGQSGEANAKVAALILNDPEVREQLSKEKIIIPDSTVFLACLHDTTTDEVSLFNTSQVPTSHAKDLQNIKNRIQDAAKSARAERILRMSVGESKNVDEAILRRSNDWSQVRPEWGLAGCNSFVVAPRKFTRGVDLGGRSFLHSYEWKEDEGFGVLEAIMTAPMVVTTWINLQYYGSTVDNKHLGSGNKTLHNVTSGIGVLEGFAGDLRSGLPMQSIHDGVSYQHEPLRLNVVINAPKEAILKVLEKHEPVRQLCDNGWMFLLAMNDEGKITDVYEGEKKWKKWDVSQTVKKTSETLVEDLV